MRKGQSDSQELELRQFRSRIEEVQLSRGDADLVPSMFLALARWNNCVSYMLYRSKICSISFILCLVLIFTLPLLSRKTFRLTATFQLCVLLIPGKLSRGRCSGASSTIELHDTYIFCNLQRRSMIITKENARRIIGFGRYPVAIRLQFSTDWGL